MIATGMATAIASPDASRRLRSRTRRPTRDGPTPFPAGMPALRGSIRSSLLGFCDFGADPVDKRPVRRERRMPRQQRVCDLVSLEQQIGALLGRRGVGAAPEVALGPGLIADREAHHRQAAGLTPVVLRIATLSLDVRVQRLA